MIKSDNNTSIQYALKRIQKKINRELKNYNNQSSPSFTPIPTPNDHNINTQLVYFDKNKFDKNSIAMPLYQTSIFVQPTADSFGEYDYTFW